MWTQKNWSLYYFLNRIQKESCRNIMLSQKLRVLDGNYRLMFNVFQTPVFLIYFSFFWILKIATCMWTSFKAFKMSFLLPDAFSWYLSVMCSPQYVLLYSLWKGSLCIIWLRGIDIGTFMVFHNASTVP